MSSVRLSQKQINQLFMDGVNQFNKQNFFEAHEFWEEIWLTRKGNEKAFFQAMILLAGAGVHYQKQRNEPAIRLLKLALIRFKESQDVVLNYFNPQLILRIHEHLTNVGVDGVPKLILINKMD